MSLKCLRTCLRQNSCFIKLWRFRKFSLFVLYVGQINRCPSRYLCPKLYIHVLTMTAAFQVILEADEDDNRSSLKQHRVFRDRYIWFTIMLFTDRHLYCLSVSELEAYLSPSPNIWLYLSPHSRARKLLLLIAFTIIWHCRRYCRENFSVSLCMYQCT